MHDDTTTLHTSETRQAWAPPAITRLDTAPDTRSGFVADTFEDHPPYYTFFYPTS